VAKWRRREYYARLRLKRAPTRVAGWMKTMRQGVLE
jgi:hypothetical protein